MTGHLRLLQEVVAVEDIIADSITISGSIVQVVHVCAAHKKPAKLMKFIAKVRNDEK